nr:nuclear transport factor 2 family protein [Rhodococcus sp. (in: high G+C Gram-positive bacteria)]
MSHTTALPAWFSRAIQALQANDIDGWMSIYAQDAVHEFPFAPPGAVRRLEGRGAILEYMSHLPNSIRFGPLSDVRVRQVDDEVIIEATGHHRRVDDDAPVELEYVWFITVRGEEVFHIRDYMNPLQLSTV